MRHSRSATKPSGPSQTCRSRPRHLVLLPTLTNSADQRSYESFTRSSGMWNGDEGRSNPVDCRWNGGAGSGLGFTQTPCVGEKAPEAPPVVEDPPTAPELDEPPADDPTVEEPPADDEDAPLADDGGDE